jgi:SAM-dependent methyltransferase
MTSDLRELAINIELRQDGIWTSKTLSAVSYPEHGNETYFAVEESSFWFRHRNNCIRAVVKALPPGGLLLDVGGGNGYVARCLQDAGVDVALVEPGPGGARNARRRGVQHVIQAALEDVKFQPGSVAGVGLFDVVEHIENDVDFLQSVRRLLRPGGRVYLSVPAYQWLWSHEDAAAGHWRRYTLSGICSVFQQAGYEVDFATYFFSFLPLPILLARVAPYRLGLSKSEVKETVQSDHNPGGPMARKILDTLTSRELEKIASLRRVRLGGSCLVVARSGTPHVN